ncbi:hypothetical protein AB3G45_01420 [Shinella sp. S4-D37]|uniref:hypothetical protein n=1 Tax=Shinella sp. S4-D37 TaxID=3161999 RepID=UPI0034670012
MNMVKHGFDIVDKATLRNGMSPLCSAVNVVTTRYSGKRYGFTASAVRASATGRRHVGYIPVPHLAARRIASKGTLEARFGRLAEGAGVTDVLVIGGGVNPPAGPFTSSMDLLETGVLARYGITDLAIAGHPEIISGWRHDDALAAAI